MKAPDPAEWLAADEGEQLDAIQRHHKRIGMRGANRRMHALMHSIIETQLAEGHAAASSALSRLLDDGLDRHEAIHAVAAVFSRHLYGALQGQDFDGAAYEHDLEGLTVAEWHRLTRDE